MIPGVEPCSRLVVGGWLADRDGVGYYRLKVPLDALERRGHAVEYDTTLRILPGKRPRSHVLVGQRVSNEGPSQQWLERAGEVRRIFEIDDDLLNVDPMSGAARAFYNDAQLRARLLTNMRSADAISVSTPYLAGVIRREYGVTAPIHVLPNYLEARVFDLPRVIQAGPMTLGWAGSDTHRGDFEYVRSALRRFFARNAGTGMTFMGVDYRHVVGAPWGEVRPWVPVWQDPLAYMRRLDWQVGLAPLAPNQFNRCKSALKALEYAARGMVVIASDVEPYRGFVQHGVTGFLVRRDHEWGEYLELLAEQPRLRAEMGAGARELASEWVIDRHIDKWEAAYSG
jgi:hypothetical protein